MRLVTQVGKISGRTGANIVFSGILGLCGHHREVWVEKATDPFHRRRSQLTSDSFRGCFPFNPIAKNEKGNKPAGWSVDR